jgi:hypothetical protein
MIEAKQVLAALAGGLPSAAGLLRRFDIADSFASEPCNVPVLVLRVAYLLRLKAV